MDWLSTLAVAIGMGLIIEGLFPFAAPALWRDTVRRLLESPDSQIRFGGLSIMLAGLLILWIFK